MNLRGHCLILYSFVQMTVLFSMEQKDDKTPSTPKLSLQKFEKKDFFNLPLLALSPQCNFGVHRNEKAEIIVSNLLLNKQFTSLPTSSWPDHIVFIDNEKLAYIGKNDNSVWVQDIFGIKIKCPLDAPLTPIKLVSTSTDLLLIVSLNQTKKGTVHLWNTNVNNGLSLNEITHDTIADQIPLFFNDQKLITYSNMPSANPSINLYSFAIVTDGTKTTTSLCLTKKLVGHSAPINDLALSLQFLASASDDKKVLIWDLEKLYPHCLVNELPHENKVVSVAFHPSQPTYILSGTVPEKSNQFGNIHLWNSLVPEKIATCAINEYSSLGKRGLRWPREPEIFVGSHHSIWHKFLLNFPELLELWRAEKNRN